LPHCFLIAPRIWRHLPENWSLFTVHLLVRA
jgi:hypothetical protein